MMRALQLSLLLAAAGASAPVSSATEPKIGPKTGPQAEHLRADLETAYRAWKAGDLAAAATMYEAAVEAGVDSADVLFNLGTLELERGRTGAGARHLLAALRRDPWHAEARFNLERVQPDWAAHRTVVGPAGDFAGWLSLPGWLVLLAVANLLFAAAVALRRAVLGAAIALLLGGPAGLALGVRHFEAQRPLLVARSELQLRRGPAARYGSQTDLTEGAILRPRDRRPGWVEVETPRGEAGWVPETQVWTVPTISMLDR